MSPLTGLHLDSAISYGAYATRLFYVAHSGLMPRSANTPLRVPRRGTGVTNGIFFVQILPCCGLKKIKCDLISVHSAVNNRSQRYEQSFTAV